MSPRHRAVLAWLLAALFALAAVAATDQLIGCIRDEHPWPQTLLWALSLLGFISLTWRYARRAASSGEGGSAPLA